MTPTEQKRRAEVLNRLGRETYVPKTHTILYGETGSGKTHSASTWPDPKLVIAFDPFGKFTPHLSRGQRVERVKADPFLSDLGLADRVKVDEVFDAENKLITRVEYYGDPDPETPTAWSAYLNRAKYLKDDVDTFQTIVLDSVTYMEFACLGYIEFHEYKVRQGATASNWSTDGYFKGDSRQMYQELNRRMTNEICRRWAWLDTNVVVIAHTSEKEIQLDAGSQLLRGISIVGQLTKKVPAGYGECYHAFAQYDSKEKQMHRWWQTQRDAKWLAQTQVGAPNPCEPTYDAIWNHQGA